jgi:hypothetical protein
VDEEDVDEIDVENIEEIYTEYNSPGLKPVTPCFS